RARRTEVGQAEALARRLAREGEALDHLVARSVEQDGVALRLRREELEDGARRHGAVRQHLVLDRGDALAETRGLLVALGEQRLEVAAQPEVFSVEHGGIDVR